MAELVDALVSGASVERRAGSSPVLGTKVIFHILIREWNYPNCLIFIQSTPIIRSMRNHNSATTRRW